MKSVAMAWIGPTLTGHGSAICGECGWTARDKTYGRLAKYALHHDEEHRRIWAGSSAS